MNAGLAHTLDSQFGPPSELVDVTKFIQSAASARSRGAASALSLKKNALSLRPLKKNAGQD